MNYDVVDRVALGRDASLGDLYSTYKDHFTKRSVFLDPKAVVESLGVRTYLDLPLKTYFTTDNRFPWNLFKEMELPPDQIYGLLLDTHQEILKGYGKFVSSATSNDVISKVRGILVITKFVHEDEIDFEKIVNKKAVIRDTVGQNIHEGTHAVSSITWGSRAIVFFDCPVFSSAQRKHTTRRLNELLNAFQSGASDITTFNIDFAKYTNINIFVSVYGDIPPRNFRNIVSLESLAAEFPKLIEDMSIVPKPIKYKMYPVFKIATAFFHKLDHEHSFFPFMLFRIRDVFEYILDINREIAIHNEEIQRLKREDPDNPKILDMERFKQKAEEQESHHMGNLKTVLHKHRMGISYFKQRDLDEAIERFSLKTVKLILEGKEVLEA